MPEKSLKLYLFCCSTSVDTDELARFSKDERDHFVLEVCGPFLADGRNQPRMDFARFREPGIDDKAVFKLHRGVLSFRTGVADIDRARIILYYSVTLPF